MKNAGDKAVRESIPAVERDGDGFFVAPEDLVKILWENDRSRKKKRYG